MHPIKSIEARIQGYTLSHFKNSNYARKLRKFKDIHRGESCFIVGNGPSLRAEDLEILHKKNIPCFAFNRIYLMFDKTNWRPTYYMSQDEKTLFNSQKQINDLVDIKYKFIPLSLKYYNGIRIKSALYFNLIGGYDGEKYSFSSDVAEGIENSTTVAHSAIQFAAYMGFSKIYLIGVDHSFSIFQNEKGEIFRDSSVKDYFVENYNLDKKDLYIPRIDRSTKAFLASKEYCDQNDIEIKNATRGGKLEVFERVDLDKLLEEL